LASNVEIGAPLGQPHRHFHHGHNVVVSSAGDGSLKVLKPGQASVRIAA
jgi:hypothetical protein